MEINPSPQTLMEFLTLSPNDVILMTCLNLNKHVQDGGLRKWYQALLVTRRNDSYILNPEAICSPMWEVLLCPL